jgi:hypothetical protein
LPVRLVNGVDSFLVGRFGAAPRQEGVPGGKRSDQISKRDLEILGFIARFGLVPRAAVVTWAATGRSATIARETRLRKAGLIRVARAYSGAPLALATKAGLLACRRAELSTARLTGAAISHDSVVAELAARLERQGERLLSEREILAAERAEGARMHSASLRGGRFHRPDLIRLAAGEGGVEAIEVELSSKGAARLDELLRAWRRAILERRVDAVAYHCAPRTLGYVERAAQRTKTAELISVTAL